MIIIIISIIQKKLEESKLGGETLGYHSDIMEEGYVLGGGCVYHGNPN